MTPATRVANVESVDASKDVFRGPEVCALVGITYRQLDYWTRNGVARASVADARGSGTQRLYSREDIVVVRAIAQMLGIASGHNASTDRLRLARSVEPHLREVLRCAGSKARVVVFETGATVATNDDELLALVAEHDSVHVLTVRGPA